MAEALTAWKVETLRAIINAPPNARFNPRLDSEEAAWFNGMIKDGYVEGQWGRVVKMEDLKVGHIPLFQTNEPETCGSLRVTEKGKKFVYDYDCRRQAAEDFNKLNVAELLKWNDKQLAEWQSRFKSDQPQWVLAEQEWKRRSGISTRRIAIVAIVVSVFSVIIAALSYFHSLNAISSTPATQSVQPAKTAK